MTAPLDLSIVIPTLDGAERLPALLDALASQTGTDALAWEVIAVDNGSADGTAEVVRARQRAASAGAPLRYEHEPRRGAAFARQAGVERARGEWVAFLDDDNLPAPDWIAQAARAIRAHPEATGFTGRMRPRFAAPPPLGFERLWHLYALFDRGDAPRRLRTERFELPPSAGFVVRRRDWLVHVPRSLRFTYSPGEDLEAMQHLHTAGCEIWYTPALRLEHCLAPERLRPEPLLRHARRAGDRLAPVFVVGAPAWRWPDILLRFVGGRLVELALHLARRRTRAFTDLVTRCETAFLVHAALSPLEFWRSPAPREREGAAPERRPGAMAS